MASGGVGAGGGQSLSHPDQARLLWLRRQLVTRVDRDKVGQGRARWDLDLHQLGNYRYLSGGLRENLEASLQRGYQLGLIQTFLVPSFCLTFRHIHFEHRDENKSCSACQE